MANIIRMAKEEQTRKDNEKKGIIATKKFDRRAFDRKAARSIAKIHTDSVDRALAIKYHKWVEKNHEHLVRLHDLSDLKCSFGVFSSFVFSNSDIKDT